MFEDVRINVNCTFSDAVVYATPTIQQALQQFVIVMHPSLTNLLLDVDPYFVVDLIEA